MKNENLIKYKNPVILKDVEGTFQSIQERASHLFTTCLVENTHTVRR